ncbi:MAG: glycosyltransferase family 4 protein [Planctomycetes bacterium]|nr:glycosyltransferase family 4 protein [Planctomycetota bacterium]
MRVLIVSQYFWPEPFRINDLALGLSARGHEVTALTGLPNYPEGRLYAGYRWRSWSDRLEDVTIRRAPLLTRGGSQGLRLAANYLSFAVSASLVGPLRCRGPYDVIFAFEPSPITVGVPAAVLRRLHHAPLLFWVQDLWPETLSATGAVKSPRVLKAVDRLARWIYARCDRVLVQSPGFASYVANQGVAAERIVYFPNWAEDFFCPVELPAYAPEHQELPPGFRILFAGNIGVSQSFPTILEAAERTRNLPEIQWIILGDGREREWVQQQIRSRRLEETVSLLGRRPVETMPRYFAAADALLVSLKREPIFALTIPSKVQSYLACGKPILAALEGEGASVIQESGAGLVGPSEDAQSLAEHAVALSRMAPTARAAMGRRGRQYCEQHFERERLLDRLESLFFEVTKRQAHTEEKRCAA